MSELTAQLQAVSESAVNTLTHEMPYSTAEISWSGPALGTGHLGPSLPFNGIHLYIIYETGHVTIVFILN